MQIACPACHTRYSVPDTAIGAKGRTVRCAKCRHSWYQPGSEEAMEAEAPVADENGAADAPPPPAPPMSDGWDEQEEAGDTVTTEVEEAPTGFAPRETIVEEPEVLEESPTPTAYEEVVIEEAVVTETVAYAEPEPVDAEYEDLDRPKRGAGRIVVICLVLLVLAAGAIYGAVRYFGAPDWLPIGQSTFGAPPDTLVLDFTRDGFDHKDLPNGRQLVATSGTITNTGTTIERVPPILVVLRDSQERIVYSWEIASPKSELGPGESVKVSEMVTDVPRSAQDIEIGWKPS